LGIDQGDLFVEDAGAVNDRNLGDALQVLLDEGGEVVELTVTVFVAADGP
jgi:hypothetical protein